MSRFPLPVNPDYSNVKSVHDVVDGLMDGRYTTNEKGEIVENRTSVIVNDEAIEQEATFDDEIVKASGKEPIGSVRNITDATGNPVVVKKQTNGRWAPAGSPADTFDKDTKGGSITGMETSSDPKPVTPDTSLVPLADKYLDSGFNVMLMGLHGTGKTETIKALAAARGLKMKYYSCSTLDPFTDLVGVPTPVYYCPDCDDKFETRTEHREIHPSCTGKLMRNLDMVRPRDVDEAELLFFDEFNRADPKVQNAVFEIIQFGSINGEKLPNLKACWAAINPPEDEQNYQVEPIDPALMDRFDVYIEITPKPSVVYMAKHMPEPIARALKVWWDDHANAIRNGTKDAHTSYISPRRLEKIGLVWCATHNPKSVYASLPPSGKFERKKLIDSLRLAQGQIDQENGVTTEDYEDDLGGDGLGDRPNPNFVYRLANMKLQQPKLAEYLEQHPTHDATHSKVVEVLKQGVGGEDLVTRYGKLLNALNPAKLEGMVAAYPGPKVNQMRQGFLVAYNASGTQAEAKTWKSLHKVLSRPVSGVNLPAGWPTTL
jgi:hypothetical protein